MVLLKVLYFRSIGFTHSLGFYLMLLTFDLANYLLQDLEKLYCLNLLLDEHSHLDKVVK